MLKVIVPNQEPRRVNTKDGKRTFTVQAAGLVGSDGLASRFEVWIDSQSTPYAPGEYLLDADKSIYVDRQGNLSIRPVLAKVPVKGAAA